MYNRYVPPSKKRIQPQQATHSSPSSALGLKPAARSDATNGVHEAGASPATTEPYARYVPPRKPKTADQSIPVTTDGLSPAIKRKHDAPLHKDDSQASKSKKPKTEVDINAVDIDTPSKKKDKEKKKDKKRTAGDDEAIGANGDEAPSEKKRKKKKQDKKGKREASPELNTGNAEEANVGVAEETHQSAAGDDHEVDEDNTAKEKRDKSKKKKKRRDVEEEDEAEDRTSSRHASVLAKKVKSLQAPAAEASTAGEDDTVDVNGDPGREEPEDIEMHGLEPLPQPAPVEVDTSKPTYETLPSWLAAPIRVAPDKKTPFSDIGISPKACKVLGAKGFKDAFAVQTAAIPLLLPSCKHRQGDLLVAAATGSGKTLAYALPIVRDISQGMVTRLRALVVLPTRELVNQAQEVFQLCAGAFDGRDQKKIRIGTSIGSQQLKQDQANIVEKTQRYDPEAYREALRRHREAWKSNDGFDSEGDEKNQRHILGSLPDHVVDYNSKVDVLICTPGRLVDHINHTPGFSLDYVRWLVVDEADKLLAQSFQGWLDVVMPKLRTNKFSARDFPDSNLSGVRKVILSATLTRDLSLLGGLQLRRPQLIVLEGEQSGRGDKAQTAEHTLPHLLKEFAIRVYDQSLKPLYLLDLLQGEHLLSPLASSSTAPGSDESGPAGDEDASSEDDSDTSSSGSDTSSSESDSDSDSDTELKRASKSSFSKTALVFTKSNESALRLSRLLSLLAPSLSPLIATLTSTQKTSHRRRILSSFSATGNRRLRILVASDLVARGIDLPALDNVINYDLPASAAGYVHRVGRTARAGRSGRAFTLVETRESGWFWGAVAKWAGIRRAEDVERLRIGENDKGDGEGDGHGGFGAEKVGAYEKALEELGREANEVRKGK